MGCLYSLTSPSGKRYLGITLKTAEVRFSKHTEHALGKRQNGVLYSALRKYRPENFRVETLVIANDWEYLADMERLTIAAFGTKHPFGCNMTDGGEGVQGPRDEKAKLAISAAQKERFKNPEQRIKAIAAAAKGNSVNTARHLARRVGGKAAWQIKKEASMDRIGSVELKDKVRKSINALWADPEFRERALKAMLAGRLLKKLGKK